jgi:hypothetical protein
MLKVFQTLETRVDSLGAEILAIRIDLGIRKDRIAKELDQVQETENTFNAMIGQ